MKKLIIIGGLLIAGLWWLILPGLVGVYLKAQVPEWTEGWLDPAQSRFDNRWFGSRLSAGLADGTDIELRGRHLPTLPPGLLDIRGQIAGPQSSTPIRLRGHFGITGQTILGIKADDLAWSDHRREFNGGALSVRLDRERERTGLKLDSGPLSIEDRLGNRLGLEQLDLTIERSRNPGRSTDLSLALNTTRIMGAPSRLDISVRNIDGEALASLIEAAGQYRQAAPGSLDQRLAALGLAGAWQQLAEAGLNIERVELELERKLIVSLSWKPAAGPPRYQGDGELAVLVEWAAALLGLAVSVPPQEARSQVRTRLEQLAEAGHIQIERGRFQL